MLILIWRNQEGLCSSLLPPGHMWVAQMAREVRHAISVIVSTSGLSYFLIFRFYPLVILISSIFIFYYFFSFCPKVGFWTFCF